METRISNANFGTRNGDDWHCPNDCCYFRFGIGGAFNNDDHRKIFVKEYFARDEDEEQRQKEIAMAQRVSERWRDGGGCLHEGYCNGKHTSQFCNGNG